MWWSVFGYALLLAGGSTTPCSPPAHLLKAIRNSERVNVLRLSSRASRRLNLLDASDPRFLGFEVVESKELTGEGVKMLARALGQTKAYRCAGPKPDADRSLAPVQIGFVFISKSERVNLVLFEPEQEAELEIDNGVGARVSLTAEGDAGWWAAMGAMLRAETQRADFYAYMRAPEDIRAPEDTLLATRDTLDRGPETDLVLPLEALLRVPPDYPNLARSAGVDGVVGVRALVGPDGRVHRVEITKSIEMLNEAAKAAVLKWQFKPPLKDAKPVWAWTDIPVRFSLD